MAHHRSTHRKLILRAAVPVALGLTAAVGLASPAHAISYEIYSSCKAGGFTGTIRLKVEGSNGRVTRVNQVAYKIDKRGGGNEANVSWSDNATLPATEAYTSNGIQDNRYHVLRERDYTRGSGTAYASFQFDKSGLGADPRCSFRVLAR